MSGTQLQEIDQVKAEYHRLATHFYELAASIKANRLMCTNTAELKRLEVREAECLRKAWAYEAKAAKGG